MDFTPAFSLGALLAAVSILALISLPVIAIWFLLSIRHSLVRIANALEDSKKAYMDTHDLDASDYENGTGPAVRTVANSAFGR